MSNITDENEKQIAAYGAAMWDGLTKQHGPAIDVVDAFLGALSLAAQFCAMLDDPARSQLCDVVEDSFRGDVHNYVQLPDIKQGVTKRH